MKALLFIGSLVLATACSTGETGEENKTPIAAKETKLSREDLLKQIKDNNTALTGSFNPDSLIFMCRSQAELCEKFIQENPMDGETPGVFAFQAKAYSGMQDYESAITSYNRLIKSFPNFENVPEAMLVKGLILDQQIKDKQRAQKAYMDLIQRFPKHPYAKDAQGLLTQLHMSDEELIKGFEAKKGK